MTRLSPRRTTCPSGSAPPSGTPATLTEQPTAIVRCILDSLAAGYARTIRDAERLADVAVDVVHIVGGGSQNRLLCQLTADATGKRVIAGPVEATALGNVLVQARAAGDLAGGLAELRKIVAGGTALERYEPLAASSARSTLRLAHGGIRGDEPGALSLPSLARLPAQPRWLLVRPRDLNPALALVVPGFGVPQPGDVFEGNLDALAPERFAEFAGGVPDSGVDCLGRIGLDGAGGIVCGSHGSILHVLPAVGNLPAAVAAHTVSPSLSSAVIGR